MPLVESWDGGGTLILKMVWLWASGSSTFSQTKSCIMNINTLNICVPDAMNSFFSSLLFYLPRHDFIASVKKVCVEYSL